MLESSKSQLFIPPCEDRKKLVKGTALRWDELFSGSEDPAERKNAFSLALEFYQQARTLAVTAHADADTHLLQKMKDDLNNLRFPFHLMDRDFRTFSDEELQELRNHFSIPNSA